MHMDLRMVTGYNKQEHTGHIELLGTEIPVIYKSAVMYKETGT